MSADLQCFRCGASLRELTPPISRQDQCPSCSVYLHVCRMCVNFDPQVPRQCLEDGAEDVIEKERLNFCDWYSPSADAFDAGSASHTQVAESELAALFGEGDVEQPSADASKKAAEDLFK